MKQVPLLEIIKQSVVSASSIVMNLYQSGAKTSFKGSHQQLVTEADIKCQSFLEKSIKTSLIAHGIDNNVIGFIGEEEGLDIKGKYLFAIDPIDGTTNFASGLDYFVISVGCFTDGALVCGVIYEPATNILYWSEKGKGAYKTVNNTQSELKLVYHDLSHSLLVSYIHSGLEQREQEFSFIKSIFPEIRGVRIMGAGALDLVKVADNTFQICMFAKSNIWDIAAASLILQEAEGRISNLDGSDVILDLSKPEKLYPILACHPDNHQKILSFI